MKIEFTFKKVLKILLFPFYVLFIALPNLIELAIFTFFKRRIKVLRKNCLFLINPTSGKKLGLRVIEVLKSLGHAEMAVDIFAGDFAETVKGRLDRLPPDERLFVVLCGGDGTANSIVGALEARLGSLERLVFAPMPIGTGNDFSRAMNLGCKLNMSYLNEYFRLLNSPRSRVVQVDSWTVRYSQQDKSVPALERQMLLYLGLGYDGRIQRKFDEARKRFRFLFKISVR